MTVIGDKRMLKEFFDAMLQPIDKDLAYIVFMVARKKWDTTNTLTRSEEMLDIKLLKDYDFGKFYRLLRRWDVPEDAYVDRNTGNPIPEVAKGYYIDLTPKSIVKGMINYIKEFMSDLYESQYDRNRLHRIRKWYRFIVSNVHKSNAKRIQYVLIDVDTKCPDLLRMIVEVVGADKIRWISETRGGYHIFVDRSKLSQSFRNEVEPWLQTKEDVEVIRNHNQTPIVGTYQGGHLVRRINIDEVCNIC